MSVLGLILVALVLGPLLLVAALYRTRFYWLPGVGLLVAGCLAFALANPEGGHGGSAVFGDGFEVLIGFAAMVYGLICWVIAGWFHTLPRRSELPPVAIPTATLVNRVSKS